MSPSIHAAATSSTRSIPRLEDPVSPALKKAAEDAANGMNISPDWISSSDMPSYPQSIQDAAARSPAEDAAYTTSVSAEGQAVKIVIVQFDNDDSNQGSYEAYRATDGALIAKGSLGS